MNNLTQETIQAMKTWVLEIENHQQHAANEVFLNVFNAEMNLPTSEYIFM